MSENGSQKVWLVTGASRGLGDAICQAIKNKGDILVRTIRRPDAAGDNDTQLTLQLDVTDEASIRKAVDAALKRFGRLDVVVNNAGYGVLGGVEEVTAKEARDLFATNVEGILNVLRATLPEMRARGSGNIVNISSLGGFSAAAGWGIYNASKFAVEGLSEALAQELAPLGLTVTIVEPGYFRTDFLAGSSLIRTAGSIADYKPTVGKMVDVADNFSGKQPGDPLLAANAIVDAVHSGRAPLRLALGADAFARISAKLESVRENLEQWKEVSHSTAFAG